MNCLHPDPLGVFLSRLDTFMIRRFAFPLSTHDSNPLQSAVDKNYLSIKEPAHEWVFAHGLTRYKPVARLGTHDLVGWTDTGVDKGETPIFSSFSQVSGTNKGNA